MDKGIKYGVVLWMLFTSCKEWENASRTSRDTYLTFFDYSKNISPVAISPTNDGFVLVANYDYGTAEISYDAARFIKIDARGNKIWMRDFPKTRVKTILPVADGFILVGDSVHAEGAASKIKLIKTNTDGILQKKKVFSIRTSPNYTGDVEVDAAAFNEQTTDSLIVLGRLIKDGAPDSIFIAKFTTSTLELRWKRREAPLAEGRELDYKNGKSLLRLSDNTIIWVACGQTYTDGIKSLFGLFPVYKPYLPNATFLNSAKIGDTNTNGVVEEYQLNDITRSTFGFGTIGTYTSSREEKSTGMLFARLQETGSLDQESILFIDYDAANNLVKTLSTKDRNQVAGTLKGEAIASSPQGGYVLAGTFFNTEPKRGIDNEIDMILIRMDVFGSVLWFRVFGGKGNETPIRVLTGAAGKITVVGEQYYKKLASAFVLQVNANGEF